MKIPTRQDYNIHRFVCSDGMDIKTAATAFGVSTSTVRRAMDRVTEFDSATITFIVNGSQVSEILGWLRNGNTTSIELADKLEHQIKTRME